MTQLHEEDFTTFQKFRSADEARELVDALKDAGIPYLVDDVSPTFDLTFTGNQHESEIRIKLLPHDFDKANRMLEELAEKNIDNYTADHYLYGFTDKELFEVLQQPDEWNKDDYALSRKILEDRGHHISDNELERLKQERIDELSKPEKGKTAWIIFGFISAVCGGILGITIGSIYVSLKKTTPDGERVFVYDKRTRKLGFRMLWIGLVGFVVWTVVAIIQWDN